MRKAFRHSIWVPVFLLSGSLVTGCQSEKDRSEKKASSVRTQEEPPLSKEERTPPAAETQSVLEKIFSPKPESQHATKSKHKRTAHLKGTTQSKPKAKAHADAKTASKTPAKDTKKSGFTSYGEGAEGAGITDPVDTNKTISGKTAK